MREDRREFPRIDIYYLVKYKDRSGSGKQDVVSSVNISTSGALLRLREKLKVGQPLDLRINFLSRPGRIISLEAEVVWVTKQGDHYKTAVKFKNMYVEDRKIIEEFVKYISGL